MSVACICHILQVRRDRERSSAIAADTCSHVINTETQ